jgi:hypothetical protein
MHLLTTKETVLNALLYVVASLWMVYLLVYGVIAQAPVSLIVGAVGSIAYGFSWRTYIRAFKMRRYDRQYNEAKKKLQHALEVVLPAAGNIEIDHGDLEMKIKRSRRKGGKDRFTVAIIDDYDISYDEETMTHTVVIPFNFYHLYAESLYVRKSYEASVMKVIRQEDSDELLVNFEPDANFSFKEFFKAERNLPADLRNASIDDVLELTGLVLNGENGNVS